ncbi:MAG: SDR family oxidoreductase [Gemmatimonadales bacterium]
MSGRSERFRLDGRVVVVTGGTGLLGTVYCAALAEAGAGVVVADRDESACSAAARTLGAAHGDHALAVSVDVADPESVRRLIARTTDRFGRLDVLINNAALRTPRFSTPVEDYHLEDWNAVVSVNLTGTFLCAQAAGRWMKAHGGGVILNVASIYGVVAPDQRLYEGQSFNTPPVYSATKAGVIGLTRYLAAYWAKDGIRVNCLTPGGVFNDQPAEFVRRYSERSPMGRMADREEMVGAVLYLASDASSHVTGHNLVVDGGWTAW